MKILFVTNSLDVGGVEINLLRLTSQLVGKGHTCTIAARSGTLSTEAAARGASLVPLAASGRPGASLLRDVIRLRRAIRDERPDVVHVFSATAGVLIRMARVFVPGAPPVVASVMGLADAPSEDDRAVRRRVQLTIAGADRVVVMAPAIGHVVDTFDVPADRIVHDTVVGVEAADPVGPARRAATRASLGVDDETSVITTIGRLEPRKSHDLFVEAAALVRRTNPRTRFFIVGDGAGEAALRARIDELDVAGAVTLLGDRRDVPDLLAATDVYVRPGVLEGFIGITVLEAQSLGVPVVSYRTEDVQLAIVHGVSGVLADNGDVADMAAKIVTLLDDRSLAAVIAERGRARFLERYELSSVVDRLLALYRDIAGAR